MRQRTEETTVESLGRLNLLTKLTCPIACATLPLAIFRSVGSSLASALRTEGSAQPAWFVRLVHPLGLDALVPSERMHPVLPTAFVACEPSALLPTGAGGETALTRSGILHTKEAPARVGSDGRGLRANLSSRCALRWTRIGLALRLRSPSVVFN